MLQLDENRCWYYIMQCVPHVKYIDTYELCIRTCHIHIKMLNKSRVHPCTYHICLTSNRSVIYHIRCHRADGAVINSSANMHSIISASSLYFNKLHVSFCISKANILFHEYCIKNKRKHLQIDRAGALNSDGQATALLTVGWCVFVFLLHVCAALPVNHPGTSAVCAAPPPPAIRVLQLPLLNYMLLLLGNL